MLRVRRSVRLLLLIAAASALVAPPSRARLGGARALRDGAAAAPLVANAAVPCFESPAVRRAARYSAAALSAWYAAALKRGGPSVNPERCAAVPIKCPWPFLLVFNPFTALGRRSLRAGLRDWQTWAALAVLLLARRW